MPLPISATGRPAFRPFAEAFVPELRDAAAPVWARLEATVDRALAERPATVRATRSAARIFFAAGAERVHAPSPNPPLVERGDPNRVDQLIDDSVTDGWGRVHGQGWLRIADSSLFPDSVEINPYLTIMALADRVAEGIIADWGQDVSRSTRSAA